MATPFVISDAAWAEMREHSEKIHANIQAMNHRFMESFAHSAALAYAIERAGRVNAWTRVFRGGGE